MIDPDTDKVLGMSAGATLALYVLNLIWRMLGKTRVEGARDRAEIDILDTLRQENKLLRERIKLADAERDAAKAEADALREQVRNLKNDVASLDAKITDLLRRIGVKHRGD